MDKLIVIVRHGDRGVGDDQSLTELGAQQMQGLRRVIHTHVVGSARGSGERPSRILFSFSSTKRALQSTIALSSAGEDIVVTDLFLTERRDIPEPQKILNKVMGITSHYGASVSVIVAHGEMPAVIAETAYEFAAGKRLDKQLQYPREACGYIVNMTTREVVPIRFDDLDEKPVPPAATQETSQPVIRGGPPRTDGVVIKRGSKKDSAPPLLNDFDFDDDIPF